MFYGTAAAFIAYHTARLRDVTPYDSAEIEGALLVASEWLDGAFHERWPGRRLLSPTSQVRDWPRSWATYSDRYYWIDATVVPVEIEHATYEAALRHLVDETALLTDYTPDKYESVSIDGAVAVKYRKLDAVTVQKQFPIIGHILGRLLGGANGGSPLSSSISRV